jgi:hypothetical protein
MSLKLQKKKKKKKKKQKTPHGDNSQAKHVRRIVKCKYLTLQRL